MIRTMMLIPMVAFLLACGILTRADDPATEVIDLSAMHAEGAAAQTDDPLPTTEESERTVEVHGDLALPLYAGDSLIEEKIIESSVIVKAMMTSFSSEVIVEADGKYAVVLKFNLAVSEYLKGTATSSIVAVWVDGSSYDTNAEANDAKAIILAERDDQWDDREAIIFLYGVGSGLGASLDAQLQLADHFLLYVGDPYSPDDSYSLHSKRHKAWLPAASSTGSIGDSQEFLLDVPPPTRTITLGDLKGRITEVTAELNGGDGSEEYRECVLNKYRYIRNQRNWPEERGYTYGAWDLDYSLVSGHPAGTVLDRQEVYAGYPAGTEMLPWLEGSGASLFDVAAGDSTASDTDGDGEYDTARYDEIVKLARPIPAGEYRFDLKESWPSYAICDFVISNEWTVTAVAPDGVLHEAFFDPVTDGNAVAADSTNGVLKPATFTDANGASSTIQRIAWESGTVKIELTPHTGLGGHVVDFIELDGRASLSLNADDAAVDAANDALSWSVSPQPWDDGDKLMLRIREVRGACSNGTVVPNPNANTGLVSDCVTLLTARDVLRGTASLNWRATTTIASWNGINVTGTPGRVTRLDLSARGLIGTIPPALAGLSALVTLDLSDNDLTGETPEDLARLRSLETLRLSGNNLTGCIPMALMSVATNDLGSLGLPGCVEGGPVPAPEGVTTMTPTPLAVPEQTPTPTSVPTQTPTPASVPTQTPTPTSVPTQTPTPTPVPTQTPTPTSVPTQTPTPTSVPTQTPAPTSVPTQTPAPTSVPIQTPTPAATPAPAPTYLTQEIPPCTPVPGSSVDPCETRVGRAGTTGTLGLILFDPPLLVADLFGLSIMPFYTTHVVLRGTYLPGTVRCTTGHSIRDPSYAGGESGGLIIYCFADVRVNAYLLGSGPSTLTVIVDSSLYQSFFSNGDDDEDYGLEQLESRRHAYERALAEGGRFGFDYPLQGHLPPDGSVGPLRLEFLRGEPVATGPPGGIGGREVVLFIRPLSDLSVEAWQVSWTWDVERREDDTVVAIHPYRDWFGLEYRPSLLEMELPALTQAVATVHQDHVAANGGRIGADESLPMLVTDANRLRQYFSDPKVGAYAPGVPTPAQPPPPCGLAVPDQGDNPGLIRDCMTLLAAKDALRGTASLNWSATTTITSWNGINVTGTPDRVTRLGLSVRGLTGIIPPALAGLSALVTLDLSDNDLTGETPEDLARLRSLETLRLSGNNLTGCIPMALMSVATNDLGSLGLPECVEGGPVPAPEA